MGTGKLSKSINGGLFSRLLARIHAHRVVYAIYCLLCLISLGVLLYSAIRRDFLGVFNALLSLLLFLLPSFLEDQLKIELSATLKIITMLFVFCAQILGEVGMCYARFPFWDDLLHWVNGFLFAAFGFSLAEIFNRRRSATFRLSPFYLALVACCFSLSIGVLWEFFEFFVDLLMHGDMQKDRVLSTISSGVFSANGQSSVAVTNIVQTVITTADGSVYTVNGYLDIGLFDTMKDLLVDFIGALIFSIIGYFHLKREGSHPLADALIPKVSHTSATPKAKRGQK
jgi:uncharacterized membrane protein YjdF